MKTWKKICSEERVCQITFLVLSGSFLGFAVSWGAVVAADRLPLDVVVVFVVVSRAVLGVSSFFETDRADDLDLALLLVVVVVVVVLGVLFGDSTFFAAGDWLFLGDVFNN